MPFVDPLREELDATVARAQALRKSTDRQRGPQYAGRVLTVGEGPVGRIAGALGGAYMEDKARTEMTELDTQRQRELANWLAQRPAAGASPQATTDWASAGSQVMHPLAREMSQKALERANQVPYETAAEGRKLANQTALAGTQHTNASALQKARQVETARLAQEKMANQRGMQERGIETRFPKTSKVFDKYGAGTLINSSTGEAIPSPEFAYQGGKSGSGKKAGTPLAKWEVAQLQDTSAKARAFDTLSEEFTDEFAGYGAAGDVLRQGAGLLGSWAPEQVQAANQWWSRYESLVELVQRNKMFGSALTAPETKLWNQARQIKPGADPKHVKGTVDEMLAVVESKRQAAKNALKSSGRASDAVDYWAGDNPSPQNPPGTPMPGGTGVAPAPPLEEATPGFTNPTTGAELQIGDVIDGMQYMGGGPNDPANWEE